MGLSAVSYAAGLLTKELAFTLPFILILFNLYFPLGETRKRWILSLLPYAFLFLSYLLLRLYLLGSLEYRTQIVPPLFERAITQLRAWVHYLATLALPLNLNVDYDFPLSHSFLENQVLISLAIFIVIALVIWKVSRIYRIFGFFALWFAITLFPTNSVFPLEDIVTDRWLYLPSVGYAVIVALTAAWVFRIGINRGPRARKIIFFFLCALTIELYGMSTLLRNFTWKNEWMLWEDAVLKSPNKDRPHNGLGLALMRTGNLEDAKAEFQRALKLNPRNGGACLNLGIVYLNQGNFVESTRAIKKALVLSPRLAPEAYTNLGVIFSKQGQTEKAIKAFEKAIQARPLNEAAYFNLGDLYAKQGDIDQAIFCVETAVVITPELYRGHGLLAKLYEQKGWKEKSQEAYYRYLKSSPG